MGTLRPRALLNWRGFYMNTLDLWLVEDSECTRSRYLGRGLIIIPRIYHGMWLLMRAIYIPASGTKDVFDRERSPTDYCNRIYSIILHGFDVYQTSLFHGNASQFTGYHACRISKSYTILTELRWCNMHLNAPRHEAWWRMTQLGVNWLQNIFVWTLSSTCYA